MNAVPPSPQQQRADTVAGFLCAMAFALAGISMIQRPGLLAPAALVVAFVAVRMTHAHRTLAALAVLAGGVAFFIGMTVSIITDSPIY
jgi:hypothetical protein